jgi:hypothetical protein
MLNKDKYLYIQGGFGNVMFQIVAYFNIVEQGHDCKIISVLTEKNIVTKLLKWKIHDIAYKKVLNKLEVPVVITSNTNMLSHLFLGKVSKIMGRKVLGVCFFNGDQNFVDVSKVNFGYYQSKAFLSQNKHNVLKIGEALNALLKKDNLKLKTKIVVHIRLGDSQWAKIHSKYYYKIIKILKKKNQAFTVITDSIKEAKVIFQNFDKVYFESNSPYLDFGLMLHAKILFTAPSTFSYWAGVSIQNPEKIYIPKFIFNKLGFPLKNNVEVI